jgi:glucose-6-phosphate dehydrogenase assembly protein OpcA
MGAVIQPERILRELDELWVNLGKEQSGESGGVLRACAMTLMVAGLEPFDETETGETLALLMRDHPSRTVVLRIENAGSDRLDARVYAQCWMPFGRRQQICCEQIEISASQSRLLDVAPVVRSLLVPDLPVALWCRSRELIDVADFAPLLDTATKVILDSAGIADLAGQVALIQRLAANGPRVGDLAWTRLTRWRESLAQMFDNPAHAARLGAIREVHIHYEGSHVPMSACYLAAWLKNSLRRELAFRFERVGECQRARVQSVVLRGEGIDASITVGQDRAVTMHAGVLDSHAVFPSLGEYDLLREELTVLGRDAVYEAVARAAPEFT